MQSRRIELVDCRSVRLHPCAKSKRRVRASGATCVARVLRPVVRDTKFIAIRPAARGARARRGERRLS